MSISAFLDPEYPGKLAKFVASGLTSFSFLLLCFLDDFELFEVVLDAVDNLRSRFLPPPGVRFGVRLWAGPRLRAFMGIRHIKIGRPSNLLRMEDIMLSSVLTSTLTPVLPPAPPTGPGLYPLLLLLGFLTGKMREMAARFLADSCSGGWMSIEGSEEAVGVPNRG